MCRKSNLFVTMIVLSYFVLAFIIVTIFSGCQTKCYPKKYGESICKLDNKATTNAQS